MDVRGGRFPSSLQLWLLWVLASAIGAVLAMPGALVAGPLGVVVAFGVLSPLPQAWVLRRLGVSTWQWIATTFVAMMIGWIIAVLVAFVWAGPYLHPLGEPVSFALATTLGGIPAGVVIGMLQSRLIAPRHGAWVWMGATALGAPAGWAVLMTWSVLSGTEASLPAATAAVLLGGAAYGVVTGAALVSVRGREAG